MLFAYLDPGSGSALLGAVFALCGALVFSAKSLFFRLIGKKVEAIKPHEGIAIFSEGKNYWGTFRPIVEELLRRDIDFSYYTMDVHDPALKIDSPHMFTRLYDRDKVTSFRKLGAINAKVLLATTPNIGTPGYPLARPKDVGRMVHVFHDPIGDVAYYAKGSLDAYDDVLMVGPQNEAPIRELEAKRGLPPKTMHVCGVPYLDEYVKQLKGTSDTSDGFADAHPKKTVIVASSWGEKGILRAYGYGYVKDLIAAGYNVIVRPHPQSYQAEKEFIQKVEKDVVSWGAEWNRDINGMAALSKADIMISDTSGVRFDFALVFERPVVTMKIARSAMSDLDAADLKEIWADSVPPAFGAETDRVDELPKIIENLLKNPPDIAAWREAHCANFGCAAKSVVDVLVGITSDKSDGFANAHQDKEMRTLVSESEKSEIK